MQKSKIVEIDGVFIGAAVLLPDAQGWLFVAADHRADEADGKTAPTLHDAQQLAKRAFFSSPSPKMAALPQGDERPGPTRVAQLAAAVPARA